MSEPINPDDKRPDENPYGVPPAGSVPPAGEPQPGSYGTPPPPASAYPPAGPSGFPPPPGGPTGYGAQDGFPPPPPVSGYGAGYAADPSDVGSAMSWGWKKFTENLWPLVLSQFRWGLVIGAAVGIVSAIAILPAIAASSSNSDAALAAAGGISIGASILVGIVVVFVALLSQIGLTNGYLTIADGRKAQLGDFFKFRNVGPALVTALVVGLAAGLLSFTYVGIYVVAFFTVFAMFFVIDRNQSFQDALRNSAQLALKYVVPPILIVLVVYLVGPLGAIVCGIGALVTMPWAYLSLTCLYRRLTGGHVAA